MEVLITPQTPSVSKRQQVYIWVRQSELVDAATGWFQSFSTRLQELRPESPQLSGDDEHVWIGLVP